MFINNSLNLNRNNDDWYQESKFTRYVKTNQPKPNADHSNIEANDDVDMEANI